MPGDEGSLTFFKDQRLSLLGAILKHLPSDLLIYTVRSIDKKFNQASIDVLFTKTDPQSKYYQNQLLQAWTLEMPPRSLFSSAFEIKLFRYIQCTDFEPDYRRLALVFLAKFYELTTVFDYEANLIQWSEGQNYKSYVLYLSITNPGKINFLINKNIISLKRSLPSLNEDPIQMLMACANYCEQEKAEIILQCFCDRYDPIDYEEYLIIEKAFRIFVPLCSQNYIISLTDSLFKSVFDKEYLLCELTQEKIVLLYKSSRYLRNNKWHDFLRLAQIYLIFGDTSQKSQFFLQCAIILKQVDDKKIISTIDTLAKHLTLDIRPRFRCFFVALSSERISHLINMLIENLKEVESSDKSQIITVLITLDLLSDHFNYNTARLLQRVLLAITTEHYPKLITERQNLLKKLSSIISSPIRIIGIFNNESNQLNDIEAMINQLKQSNLREKRNLELWEQLLTYKSNKSTNLKRYLLIQISELLPITNFVFFEEALQLCWVYRKQIDKTIAEKLIPVLIECLDNESKKVALLSFELINFCLPINSLDLEQLESKKSIEAKILIAMLKISTAIEEKFTKNQALKRNDVNKTANPQLTINYT